MMIVDMHCHVLPGVDDGPATMAETIEALKEANRQGITTMIVTPHFHPGRFMVTAGQVLETLGQVRQRASEENLPIRLLPGQECYYYSGLLAELEAGNALTLNSTDYILVEFEADASYSTIIRAVRELRGSGYKPIIAHFERNRCLFEREERLEELRKYGGMLQLNFDRLIDNGSLFHPNGWRKLVKTDHVDFLGSDTHGMKFRPLKVSSAMKWLCRSVDQEIRTRILEHNIELILKNKIQ